MFSLGTPHTLKTKDQNQIGRVVAQFDFVIVLKG